MTSNQPSTHSRHNNLAPKTRQRWVIGGVVIAVCLSLIFGFSSAKQAAIDSLVKNAQAKSGSQQEQTLKTLSVVAWRNDAVQRALGDYYVSINRYDLAGETLAKGSTNLSVEAAKNYGEAGEYTQAQAELSTIPRKQITAQAQAEMARTAFNLGDIAKGCSLADEARESSLQVACKTLSGEVSREASYQLFAMRVYVPTVRILELIQQKTAGDWLTLARIYARQQKNSEAAQRLSHALESFPFDREVAQVAADFCRQQGSGVQECRAVSESAQKALTATDFKS